MIIMNRSICPLDGRYNKYVCELRDFFSEYSYVKYRVYFEIDYLIWLSKLGLFEFEQLNNIEIDKIRNIKKLYSYEEYKTIKEYEKITQHDVKAVEYYIRDKLKELNINNISQWIHFGLTSQDVNTYMITKSLKDYYDDVFIKNINSVYSILKRLTFEHKKTIMLSRTHGQTASPTTFGKEIKVFLTRLEKELYNLNNYKYSTKLSGSVGNFHAFHSAYPTIEWNKHLTDFVESLGLQRETCTTQIYHHIRWVELFDIYKRISMILMDFCVNIWLYSSHGYISWKKKEGQIGSSVMPHKSNPIEIENAEGNLWLNITMLESISKKLSQSRFQRDLTDSTILRNLGVVFGYQLLSIKMICKGLERMDINVLQMLDDVMKNHDLLAEAYQTILRKNGIKNGYEIIKKTLKPNISHKNWLSEIMNEIQSCSNKNKIKADILHVKLNNFYGICE